MADGHGPPLRSPRPAQPSQATRVFTRVLHRRYAWYTLGLLCFIALMAALERMGWPRTWIGGTFMIGTVAVYAAIGLMSRTTDEVEYYVAGRRVPAIYNGMATAADWMSAASFIGTAGVLYLQGFSGLAYILGWTGGYCLVALLLAPYLRRLGFFTVPEFLGARYGGVLPRVIGVLAVVLVSFVYVVVQIYGVGLITSHLTGFSFEIGIFVGLGGVLVCSFLGGMRAVTWTQVAQYIVLIVAYLTPVFWLSINQTGSPFPLFSYGRQLEQVGLREQKLLDDPREALVRHQFAVRAEDARRKLADVPQAMADDAETLSAHVRALQAADAPLGRVQQAERRYLDRPRTIEEAESRYRREAEQSEERARPLGGMPRQAQAYPPRAGASAAAADPDSPAGSPPPVDHAAQRNFLALVFCLMLGTAAMPHVLTRYYTTPSATEARKSVAWSLFFIALLYLAAPALAVMVKYEVFTNLIGTPFDQLPSWIRRWSKLDSSLVSVEDINGDGILQLAELKLAGDVIVLAAPEIGGLPLVVTYLVAAGGLAAALSTADGLLLTISNALSHDLYFGLFNPRAPAMRRVMLSKFLVLVIALVAAFIASMRLTDILQFVTAAFSLAAAAFFPALVFGIFWGRANRIGVTLGMLAGLATCAAYMVMAHPLLRHVFGITLPLEQARLLDVDAVTAGVFGVPVGALVLVVASLLTRPPGPEQLALVERARNPALEGD